MIKLLIPISLTAIMFLTACSNSPSSSNGGSSSSISSQNNTAAISGTITLPAAQNNKQYSISFCTNTNSSATLVTNLTGSTSGSTISYKVSVLPKGNYILAGVVNVMGEQAGQPLQNGDYLGFYPGYSQTTNIQSDTVLDFTLSVYNQ